MTRAPAISRLDPAALDRSARLRAAVGFRELVKAGRLRRGEVLPSERTLAEQIGVSRPTLRALLQDLERQGKVQSISSRKRVITAGSNQLAGDSRTVLLLVDESIDLSPLHTEQQGYWGFTSASAIAAVHQHRLHALTLRVDALSSDDLEAWVQSPPRGVVVLASDAVDAQGPLARAMRQLRHHEVAMVRIGSGESLPGVWRVASDHRQGAAELVRCLARAGRRRVLRLWRHPNLGGRANRPWLQDRDRGYLDACAELGLTPLPPVWVPPLDFQNVTTEIQFQTKVCCIAGSLLEAMRGPDRPDAIMAMSDGDVPAIAAALRRFSINPQTDVAIVGYDNYWSHVTERQWEPTPPLFTVDKCNGELGRRAVELLLDPGPSHGDRSVLIPPRVIAVHAAAATGPAASFVSLASED